MHNAVSPQHRANPAQRLADAALVLDQREADVIIAILAKTDPGRNRDFGFCHQFLGELQRAQMLVLLGNFCPDVHGCLGLLDHPADGSQS